MIAKDRYIYWVFRAVLMTFALLAVLPFTSASAAEPSAKAAMKFVDGMADRTLAFIQDETLGYDEKKERLRDVFQKNFDVDTIARFALGRYWRVATPEQRREYLQLFNDLVVEFYANRFEDYEGQSFKVTGVYEDGSRDFIVESHIENQDDPRVPVDWRVRARDGHYRIVDVIVNDVSMIVTKRADFASIIQRGGGNIEVLLVHLRERTGKL